MWLVLVFASCKNENLKNGNYYFPIQDFFAEKTYHYTNLNDTIDQMYWKMKAYESKKDTFLLTTVFDSKKRITDSTIERISNGNSIMTYYTIVQYDINGVKIPIPCVIVDSAIYMSKQKENSVMHWKISFKDASSLKINELSRKRILKETSENRRIFHDYLNFRVVGTNDGYSYSAVMTYQKNVGLAAYKMTLPDGTEKDYILTDIK